MRILTQEFEPPQISEGAFIEGEKSLFSVIVPEATENLVANPSPVLNTTGYSAMAGAIASSSTRQRRGPNSIRVAPTSATSDGAYYGTVTTATGWNTFSLDFWGYPGVPYKVYFATTGAALLGTAVEFVGEGLWRRPEVKLYEAAGTTRRVYFTKNSSADTNYFYVDGLQVEAKDHSTTFCTGDMVGFVPGQMAYYWTGTRYGSSSIRIYDTGSGGKVVPLSDYGFRLLGFTGLGMAPASNISSPYARIDGENYQTTRMEGRDFSLLGEIGGSSPREYSQNKIDITNVFHPMRTPTRQPLLIRYQYVDDYGYSPSDDVYLLSCSYIDGLKGNITNKYRERIGINFRMPDPYIALDGVYGTALVTHTSLDTYRFVRKNPEGTWSTPGTLNGPVNEIVEGPDGLIYIGGSFTDAGGVTDADGIACYNPISGVFTALGTGASGGGIYDIAFDSQGRLYACGDFTSMGGVANTSRIAYWDGSWHALGTGAADNIVKAMKFGLDGTLYVGGTFSQMGGVAGTAYWAKWTGAAWVALGAVVGVGDIKGIAVDKAGSIYFTGAFSSLGGVTVSNIAKLTGSTITALGTGLDDSGVTLEIGPDNLLYAGGLFHNAGGVSAMHIASWNGNAWSGLSSGLSSQPSSVHGIVFIDSLLYAYSLITTAGGINVPNCAVWNGSSWSLPDFANIPGSTPISICTKSRRGDFYFGHSDHTAIDVSSSTSVVLTTYLAGSPTITFSGAGAVYKISNATTHKTISFNLTMLAGEVAYLKFDVGRAYLTSTIRGDISSAILAGSNTSDFVLVSGTNIIEVLAMNSASMDVARYRFGVGA